MRVALLHPLHCTQFGGDGYLQQWRQAVNRAGVDVLTPLQGQRPIATLAEARSWVRERDWSKVDVVHAELLPGASSAYFVLMALAELPARPALSATPHVLSGLVWQVLSWRIRLWSRGGLAPSLDAASSLLSCLRQPALPWQERRLARRLDGLVAHTPLMAQELVRSMRLPASKIHVIPYGTATMSFAPLPDDAVLRLLYVGAGSADDDLRCLLDAIAAVLKARPEQLGRLRLTLVGAYAETVGAVDDLMRWVKDRDLSGLVDMLPDVSPDEVPSLIQRHHLLVLPGGAPSKFGLASVVTRVRAPLAWAMGGGRGAIVSGGAMLAEQLPPGAGVLVEPGRSAPLAAALENLLLSPEPLSSWSRAAAVAAPLSDWERIGHAFYGHFQSLGERRAKVRARA